MSISKRYSDQIKGMYFMIEDENFSDQYVTVWKKDNGKQL